MLQPEEFEAEMRRALAALRERDAAYQGEPVDPEEAWSGEGPVWRFFRRGSEQEVQVEASSRSPFLLIRDQGSDYRFIPTLHELVLSIEAWLRELTPLERFGDLMMARMRDRAIHFFDTACDGSWKAPGVQELQADLAALSPAQRDTARRALLAALDTGVHDFLFALVEAHDFDQGIEVLVDGENVVELSDGLQAEPWGEDGWIARFSQYDQSRD